MNLRLFQRGCQCPLSDIVRSLAILSVFVASGAQAEPAKIVGVGAAPCKNFNEEIVRNPAVERDYVAWAQGLMSGILLRAPAGVDESLDLIPSNYPLQKQAGFLRSFCQNHPDRNYGDGVLDLYRLLRNPPS